MNSQTFEYLSLKLRETYENYMAFPLWSIKYIQSDYNNYAQSVICYYNSQDNKDTTLQNVKELAIKREPVNIAMNRYYDKIKLKELFGYGEGVYGKFDNSVNISMFAKTPFYVGDNKVKNLNILSVIAPAFDTKLQPDYSKFFKNNNSIILRFKLLFDMIFNCAVNLKLTSVYITGFGTGAFRNTLENYKAGFKLSYDKWKNILEKNDIKLFSWSDGAKYTITSMFPQGTAISPAEVNYCELPKYFSTKSQQDLDKSLYINAWDCFSIVGNGNRCDNSWDGFLGRDSALAVLTHPFLNPFIKYEDISTKICNNN